MREVNGSKVKKLSVVDTLNHVLLGFNEFKQRDTNIDKINMNDRRLYWNWEIY